MTTAAELLNTPAPGRALLAENAHGPHAAPRWAGDDAWLAAPAAMPVGYDDDDDDEDEEGDGVFGEDEGEGFAEEGEDEFEEDDLDDDFEGDDDGDDDDEEL